MRFNRPPSMVSPLIKAFLFLVVYGKGDGVNFE